MASRRMRIYIGIAFLLILLNLGVFAAVVLPSEKRLAVSFLDVGQGDAILIKGPTGLTMLIDGGPDRSVLRTLAQELYPWERRIDVMVSTHPDKDHIGGLGDVLERYEVKHFIESGVPDQTSVSEHVKDMVAREQGMTRTVAMRGMRIHLGRGAYADVLFPDRDQSNQTASNDGSVAIRLAYGSTSFMLTGDLPSTLEDHLVGLDGGRLQSTVLKAGHHGSRSSTDGVWLRAVDPDYVVISAGKDNPYGHPHAETLERIRASGAFVLSTIESGTVTFVSDEREVRQRP